MAGRPGRPLVAPEDCYHYRWRQKLHMVPAFYVTKAGVKQVEIDWFSHRLSGRNGRCRICGKLSVLGMTDCANRPCHKTCAEAEMLADRK